MTLKNPGVPTPKSKEFPVTIEPATIADFENIQRIHKECWLNTYVGIDGVSDEDVQHKFAQTVNNLDKFRTQISNDKKRFLIAKDSSGNLAGFGVLSSDGSRNFIESLYIKPKYQRRGISKEILLELITKSDGKLPIVTRCVLKNIRAINFYEKLGFKVMGEPFDGQEMLVTKSRMKSTYLKMSNTNSLIDSLRSRN
jgi:ribosomal protein S18 acetylase RimI-like enzyme